MLEGKIGDFSLPDIFQLIALTKKSGSLNISTDQKQGRILFKGGEVCFAVADVARVAIGARLVQAGLTSEDEVIAILEARRAEGGEGNLSQALLEGTEVDEGALDAFIRASIEDAVFEMMRLTDASFAFDAAEESDEAAGISVSTEHLVIEGGRRMGEWAAIREHVPSSEAVLAVAPAAGDGEPVTLSSEQWKVLSLIDGRRTVGEVVDLSGKGEFTTAQLLSEMVSNGLVAVAESGEGALAQIYARRDKLRRIEELELGAPVAPRAASPKPKPKPAPKPAAQPVAKATTPPVEVKAPELPEPVAEPVAKPDPAPVATAEPEATPEPAAPPVPEAAKPELEPSKEASEALAEAVGGDGAASSAPAPKSEGAPTNGHANGHANGKATEIDRSQVARDLASLGLDDEPAERKPVPAPEDAADAAAEPEAIRRLTRDEDVNKGLLLRLIDGVKGA